MEIITQNLDQFRVFVLVLVRSSVILVFLPIFGSRNWPLLAKLGFVLLFGLILFPLAKDQNWPLPASVFDYGLIVAAEMLVALCLGLAVDLVLAGVQLGGQLVGFQLGFSIVNVIDPQSGNQISIIGQFLYLITILLFLVLNGHHLFIQALAESLTAIQPGKVSLSTGLLNQVMSLSLTMFGLAIKLVAPALAVLLFSKTIMGVIAKAVPQINIMIVSFPLNIGVGLFFIGLSLAWVGTFMQVFVERDLGLHLSRALRALGGGG